MRLLFAVVLVLVPFTGCLDGGTGDPGEDAQVPTPRWGTSAWKDDLSKPVYDSVQHSIHYLDAEDGTRLAVTVTLPAGLAAGATVPTLLQMTPYQAGRAGNPVTGIAGSSASWQDYVLRGAAYVAADERGTNASAGCLDFGGSADRSDAKVFVQWIKEQPWSNGVVVTDGISHPGMGSLVGHAAVPGITAALAHAPVVSYYQDQWLMGARMEQVNEIYQQTELSPTMYTDLDAVQAQAATCTGETLAGFAPLDGPFTAEWADRDLSRHIDPATTAPVLLTQGFVDLNVHPDHVQLYWDALPDDFPKHAIFGYWYHGWPDMDGHAAETFADLRHRWLDATLFGIDNGLWLEPRVLVEDSQGTWHEGHDWPLEPSETVVLHATPDGALAATSDAGDASYDDPVQADRGVWADAHVAFRTPPLTGDRLVNGAPEVTLVASSTATSTKWVVYLLDEAPDGSWQRVSHGYADSHWRTGEGEWVDLEPGQAETWTIPLFPTAVVVEAGHRLTLVVTSQDSAQTSGLTDLSGAQCFDDYRGGCYSPTGIRPATTLGQATNTVHLGPDGSRVSLAWVDPARTAKAPTA